MRERKVLIRKVRDHFFLSHAGMLMCSLDCEVCAEEWLENVWDVITTNDKTFDCGERCGHRNCLIVQDEFTNQIQNCPMKTHERKKIPHQLARVDTVCQDLEWSHRHRFEVNGMPVRRVKEEETLIARVQSGPREVWQE